MIQLPPLVIIIGHYGVGKTNLALNLARIQRVSCQKTANLQTQSLIDLDVVNPYFRSSDHAAALASFGIRLLGPVYGSSTLDTPSLMPGIDAVIAEANPTRPVIVDVGGDSDGARALARFAPHINRQIGFMVIYVVNSARPEIAEAQDAVAILREIESISGVSATHIAGNTHLKDQTLAETVICSLPYLRLIAQATGLPIAFVTAPRLYVKEVEDAAKSAAGAFAEAAADAGQSLPVLPVDIFVGNLWERLASF